MVGVHVGGDMKHYSAAAGERTMKVQEVILQALAKRISWWQAAEILGLSDRQMRRWRRRYETYGVRRAVGSAAGEAESAPGGGGGGRAGAGSVSREVF